MVGSSSSIRSAGHIRARASCSRIRQPPEKLFTGRSSSALLKPRPISIAWARGRASKPPASLIAWWASAMSWPSPLASARARYALASASTTSPCEHEVGRAFAGFGHLLGHLGDPPARRHGEIAGVGREPAGEQGEQRRLAGAVAAHQADLLAGVDGDAGAVEDELDAAAQRQLGENEHAAIFAAGVAARSAPGSCGLAAAQGRSARRSIRTTASSPALVSSQAHSRRGKAASKRGALVADLEHAARRRRSGGRAPRRRCAGSGPCRRRRRPGPAPARPGIRPAGLRMLSSGT